MVTPQSAAESAVESKSDCSLVLSVMTVKGLVSSEPRMVVQHFVLKKFVNDGEFSKVRLDLLERRGNIHTI